MGGGRAVVVKLHYNPEADSLYIDLLDRPAADSQEVADGVVLDLDADGVMVGIDVEHASERIDLSRVDVAELPIPRST